MSSEEGSGGMPLLVAALVFLAIIHKNKIETFPKMGWCQIPASKSI